MLRMFCRSMQQSKCLYTALSVSLTHVPLPVLEAFGQPCLYSLLHLGQRNWYTTLDLFCLGTLSFAFVNKFSLVVVTLVLICTFVMLRQRNSFLLSARKSCSPLVPMYGISSKSVGLVRSILLCCCLGRLLCFG